MAHAYHDNCCSDPLHHLTSSALEKKLLAERLEQRIVQRIPVPYLTNKAHFCGMTFCRLPTKCLA